MEKPRDGKGLDESEWEMNFGVVIKWEKRWHPLREERDGP